MGVSIIYCTVSSKDEAKSIAHQLLNEKLVACANIMPSNSIYVWEGALKETEEYIMLVKTKQSLAQSVVEKIKKIHSYECPAIMELKAESVDEQFSNWINSVTS